MQRTAHPHPQRRQQGLSLVESLIALAIAAVATGASLPGFQQALEQRRLEGAAAQLQTDLQLARSEAVAQNRTLRISFIQQAGGSCYVIHSGAAGSCQCGTEEAPVCTAGGAALRSMRFAPSDTVKLQSNVGSMVLDGSKGTVSPTGTLRLSAADGRRLHLVVNVMGRTRKCSPEGAVPGYPTC